MNDEIWKYIPEFSGCYEVSNLGNVRGWFYGGRRRKLPKLKKIQINKNGYSMVVLSNGELVKGFYVHRLVLSTFDKPMPKHIDCCHTDHDKQNCKLDNLSWGTRKENEHQKMLAGRVPVGVKNGASKMKEADVIKIRELFRDGLSTNYIAKKLGFKQQNVWHICNYKTWKHI